MECYTFAHRLPFVGRTLCVVLSLTICQSALAGSPRVTFDVAPAVSCRDVTTPEFAKANPQERLVEAKFTVSSLIQDGKLDDLIEYMIRLESPEQTALVIDYAPKTTLTSDYAGTLTYEVKDERNNSLGAGISGEAFHVKASTSGESGHKSGSTVKYELLPPLEQLSASGTYARGHGVYFKLQPSRRTSLEGAKEFQVVLRVPAQWRGDYVFLRCEAKGFLRGMVRQFDEETRWGSRSFIVPLYLEGDAQAHKVAEQFVAAEAALRSAATAERASQKKASHDLGFDLTAVFSTTKPKSANEWLDKLVFGPIETTTGRVTGTHSSEIRAASAHFATAKLRMFRLSQGQAKK